MKDFKEHMKGEKYRGGHKRGHHHGAKTFRRGRALDFLERLHIKRTRLKQQLDSPEYVEIRQVILGELKAIELVIDEFTRHFELHETEERELSSEKIEKEEKE
ncbi:hypothetical protein [Priestia endophytica]|jgi:hypothetical protein|uniref:hypothetical protein n=1 Tax=Priestia endophytica TaxID=135735 RepID=UPI000F548495|nr:hypothetical protein [Priestia endophytica]RPK09300.1 hypothetical protein FH5_04163 [Priestia endophytica]